MSLPHRFIQLGEIDRNLHTYIAADDLCYFIGEYLSGGGNKKAAWELSEVNRLLINFKKSLSFKNTNQWNYKIQAIAKIAHIFAGNFNASILKEKSIAFIPMPPSKARSDGEFDSRMHDVLQKICSLLDADIDIRDCLSFSGRYKSSHTQANGDRTSLEDLYKDLIFDSVSAKIQSHPKIILLFDDLLTTGRHFKAAQRKLKDFFPDTQIMGMFFARRVFINDAVEDFEDIEI